MPFLYNAMFGLIELTVVYSEIESCNIGDNFTKEL